MDDILILYGEESRTQDEYGVWHIEKAERTVYCRYTRVSMNEFYSAGRNGINPEFRFIVFAGDYKGEIKVGFRGNTYAVYRTYEPDTDHVELYVKREGGTNGGYTD